MKQQNSKEKLNIFAIGMAMFSMFFGSGNIIFPVLIGQATKNQANFAIGGLLLTAVLVPFVGLISLSLFDGKYLTFFSRLGRIPGWAIVIAVMGLIGPFAVIPRCIVISHGSLQGVFPSLGLPIFSAISCGIIFLCTFKKNNILDILGLALTPILLVSLLTIIIKGLFTGGNLEPSPFNNIEAFFYGLSEGYNTMDLFASFMFSSVVLEGIKKSDPNIVNKPKKLMHVYLKSSILGMGILAFIYIGMCKIAASHGSALQGISTDKLLGALTTSVLGNYGGYIVSIAVSLACLTTAISLSLVFAEFVCQDLSKNKIKYHTSLVATLIVSFVVSTLEFNGIQALLVPILKVSLPALMVLTVLNLAYKFRDFKPVKGIVFLTFALTLLYYIGLIPKF